MGLLRTERGTAMQITIPIPDAQGVLCLPSGIVDGSEEGLFRFCQANRELRIERSAEGEIIVMSPAGGYSSFQNNEVASQLHAWAKKDGSGIAFDSSAGFRLPNGAMRSPDAAWVRLARLQELSEQEKQRFIPLCPDFLIEVASPSDDLGTLRQKMVEYRAAGLPQGWLILPESRQVEIYTPTGVEILSSVDQVSGGELLPGFTLELGLVWSPPF
jgi:Uma2 family endonuclease